MRIVSATHADLAEMCRRELFRSDLYAQLSAITVTVPSLRERGEEDIRLLAHHFLECAARKHGRPVRGFTDEALHALATYPWPGHEQELDHVVEAAVILRPPGELISLDDLAPRLRLTRPC